MRAVIPAQVRRGVTRMPDGKYRGWVALSGRPIHARTQDCDTRVEAEKLLGSLPATPARDPDWR